MARPLTSTPLFALSISAGLRIGHVAVHSTYIFGDEPRVLRMGKDRRGSGNEQRCSRDDFRRRWARIVTSQSQRHKDNRIRLRRPFALRRLRP